MEKDNPKPEPDPSGNRRPPRSPNHTAVGLGPEDDDSDKSRRFTITKVADGEGRFIRQSGGGRDQHGHVMVRVEPNQRGKGIVISNNAPSSALPAEFSKPATDGIRLALDERPMDDILVSIVGGSSDRSASNELAFKMAGCMAIMECPSTVYCSP